MFTSAANVGGQKQRLPEAEQSLLIDVNYSCRMATIILAGPQAPKVRLKLGQFDLMTGRSRRFRICSSFPFSEESKRLWECANLAFCARFASPVGTGLWSPRDVCAEHVWQLGGESPLPRSGGTKG